MKPNYFFVNKIFNEQQNYEQGFSVNEIFPLNGVGITTAHDEFVIKNNKQELLKLFNHFQNSERNSDLLHEKFNVKKKEGWNIIQGYDNIKTEHDLNKYIEEISFRPFDNRFIFYEDKLVWRTVKKVMKHFQNKKNVGLVISRQCVGDWRYVFITKLLGEFNLSGTAGRFGSGNYFPLYLYPETTSQQNLLETNARTPNLNPEIVKQIADGLGIPFVPEKDTFVKVSNFDKGGFAPIDLLDYIYAVLHSPTYREKYKEFLKIDFPRVPYPKSLSKFETLTKLGSELRQIHLLESPIVEKYITQYPEDGDNVVRKPTFVKVQNFDKGDIGRVYINETQYFDNVPEVAWNFYIGGYQPAQKWLKDRKGSQLSHEDIFHYQKIIVALSETDRIMAAIDTIEI
ncbi:MAG TPA: type ISP restriction/modification enzyme [Flavobacterium sp.]|nr:type ISP restriction/modification enzyme [Flavobacterium sp.]